MKNGLYKVTLAFSLANQENEEASLQAIVKELQRMIDDEEDTSQVAKFEMDEEHDPEYHTEEDDEIEELNFDEAA